MGELPRVCCPCALSQFDEARPAEFLAGEAYPRFPSIMALSRRDAIVVLVTILALVSAVSTIPAQLVSAQVGTARPDILFVQAPVIRAGWLPERFPKGSRIVRLAKQSTSPVNLTPVFFAAADPQVSFDGSRVLFAAKQEPQARWQIWEMNTDGSGKRQLTHCPGDCLRPAYLPRDEIVFTVSVAGASQVNSQLYVSKRDGSAPHPITFGPGDYQLETVLRNGLILASARSPLQPRNDTESSRELYTLRPDGSGLASLRCDHHRTAIRSEAEELDDGSVIFVKSRNPGPEVGGELAAFRRGALHNSLVSPLRVLAWSPRQLTADTLIVARKAVGPNEEGRRLDLYAFDTARGRFEGLIYRDPKLSSVAAVPVAAHPAPRWYWSTLNPALQVGYFICLDCTLAADAPNGRLPVSPSKVRLLALDPATVQESSLGEAPVEKDGSFYIAVPPDRPLRFELLDAGGRVLRAQRSWIWTRSGEEHGCVGCHEDRAVAPENRWPLTLRRFDTPTRLGVEERPQPAH